MENQQTLLQHFQSHKAFVNFQPQWSVATTDLFDRLAMAVNALGLDWWFTDAPGHQLRFGRRGRGRGKGKLQGSLGLRKIGITLSCRAFSGVNELQKAVLTDNLVTLFEAVHSGPVELVASPGRSGYWPDDYNVGDEIKLEIPPKIEDEHEFVMPAKIEDEPKLDLPPKNIIYYGPPGTGKTFQLQGLLLSDYTDSQFGERFEFVTFHQSYGYEEFVEGLRPVITNRGEKPTVEADTATPSNGEILYEIKPGAFLRICEKARKNPSRKYAIFIDEINRGNISKIFGELITLVEVNKREGAKCSVAVTLPYSGEVFSVPSNIDVIGTMNTADRSLALVDTALRRRFEFIELMPEPSVLSGIVVSANGVDINVEQLLTMLNKRIEALYDRDHTVGHAYFTRLKDMQSHDRFAELRAVFKNRIIPLLEEYFFEDWQKIRLVLGDNQKSKKEHQFIHEIGREEDLLALFGREHELDQYTLRSRYQLNAGALDQPAAYVGIYSEKAVATDAPG